ncbi:esterase family protein, partial [Klebsiella pneumoniae]|nr:esterase family protein [Klebsiella pneumoniae]
MKRHAIYFALALAGAAFTIQAAPLPAVPEPSLPVSHFITQVIADKAITYRLFPPHARGVSIGPGATQDTLAG